MAIRTIIEHLKNRIPGKDRPHDRNDTIVWGATILLLVACGVVLTDGYIFYTMVVKKRDLSLPEQKIEFPKKETEYLIQILDNRQKKLLEIFENIKEETSTSTKK